MGANMDEEIIEAQKIWENKNKSDINHEVYVNGEVYTFHEVNLLSDCMRMKLPEQFRDMPQGIREIKYPMSDRPPVILTNVEATVDFTFQLTPAPCKPDDVPQIMKMMKQMLGRMMPHYKLNQEYQGTTRNGIFSAYDYSYQTLDNRVYTLNYGVCINQKFMLGGFVCPVQDKDLWKDYVLDAIKTIVDLTREEEK